MQCASHSAVTAATADTAVTATGAVHVPASISACAHVEQVPSTLFPPASPDGEQLLTSTPVTAATAGVVTAVTFWASAMVAHLSWTVSAAASAVAFPDAQHAVGGEAAEPAQTPLAVSALAFLHSAPTAISVALATEARAARATNFIFKV